MKIKKVMLVWLTIIMMLAFTFPVMAQDVNTEILSDFDVFDAEIRDVFRSLAEIGDINVLFDPTVKGNVTIKLKHGMKIKEAIELLAQTYGYSYRWIPQSRTVLIGDEKNFASFETKEVRIYKLNYAKPDDVAKAIETVVEKNKIGIDQRTNQVTVRASVLEHQNIADIIKRLDREMPQINIDAKLLEFYSSDLTKLGIHWDTTYSITSTLPIKKFDPYFKLTANANEAFSKGKLLANPNISTTDSQEGKIFIGEKVPIVTRDVKDGEETYKIEYIEIGTILTIIPRINEDNIVTVLVKAEVSTITRFIPLGNGDQIPLVSTREASSVIRLEEGQTFALSGLKQNSSKDNTNGLPWLSKIPIIGQLFGNKTTDDQDKELVIFITPRIVYSEKYLKEKERQEAEEAAQKNEAKNLNVEPKSEAPAVATNSEEDTYTEPAIADSQYDETEAQDLLGNTELEEDQGQYTVQYTVKSGDTLNSIASKYGISADIIREANGLDSNAKLSSGQVLTIVVPEEHLYRVKPKDTLWRLSKRYGTTVNSLLEINNMSQNTVLEVDQILVLPVAVNAIADSSY
ncbi:MAG TPA: LysM peptidoglycan-binding domain-containing protein [Bacillota bacterium]|nr:LysM peptidoglycan-binding domain-containing protein [Bacillota bacterium]